MDWTGGDPPAPEAGQEFMDAIEREHAERQAAERLRGDTLCKAALRLRAVAAEWRRIGARRTIVAERTEGM